MAMYDLRLNTAELDRVLLALENDSTDEALEVRETISIQRAEAEAVTAPAGIMPPPLFELLAGAFRRAGLQAGLHGGRPLRYRVAAFGTVFYSPSLMGALVLVASLHLEYPAARVSMRRFAEDAR